MGRHPHHHHHRHGNEHDATGDQEALGDRVPGYSNWSVHPYMCMPRGNNWGSSSEGYTLKMMLQGCTGSCAGFTFPSNDGVSTYYDVNIYAKTGCTIVPEFAGSCDDVLVQGQKISVEDLMAHGAHWYAYTRNPICPHQRG
eukprot:CAMPEP_0119406076 /NCGR_PEP_ID=MMETSP1335-20130426/546_1 /TAXON_ID=259385 /ORGANISM="Chrysoculter rhomboideus, Strain RCC1486" /LENGTH=140 /DNA_ID=CAMNT_0007430135 /DNA_START=19 /DNA_END=441 /DNA_ORIENTATION=+